MGHASLGHAAQRHAAPSIATYRHILAYRRFGRRPSSCPTRPVSAAPRRTLRRPAAIAPHLHPSPPIATHRHILARQKRLFDEFTCRLLRHADLTIMGRVRSSGKLGLSKGFFAPCPGDCIPLVTAASCWPEKKISGSNLNSFGAKTRFPM